MSKATEALAFAEKLAPVLRKLGESLFHRYGGNERAAVQEITRIQDSWGEFRNMDAAAKIELEQMRKASGEP